MQNVAKFETTHATKYLMSTIQIKPELLHALTALQGDSFTVAMLTTYYLDRPESPHRSKKPARQFVYRNMVRLMKAGLMEKLPDDGGWPKYQLTQKFRSQYSSLKKPASALSTLPPKAAPPVKALAKAKPKKIQPKKPVAALRERLSKHRSDMLCALGEAEEYESLCKELPEFSEEEQSLYAEARERSALLLGKIKALESLLSSNNLR
ncbi:MAG: hypothetical protein VB954_15205 [Thalassolituus sp.]|jgi:hypothetical protein|uniref:hypothetical protein n=2 Tax=Gammaproteobacteria TaxID=1236 RepID=UPI001E4E4F5A|nr:hypothetical protein [Thalassolituus oleivorans]|tara:strand:- start:1278 stop:1901 length:624 start_codon:yes stop_codon:yes gene_type:complete